LERVVGSAESSWRQQWYSTEAEFDAAIVRRLHRDPVLSGAGVADALNDVAWEALVVGSSLPIREVDAHLARTGPVYANRGASGIDGFTSLALGVASLIPRTIAYCGDISLLHDSNGFLHDGDIDLTMVVVDNGGGGLFDSLPLARHAPSYERLFVADPDRDLVDLIRFHGGRAVVAQTREDLAEMLRRGLERHGLDVVVVPVDRTHDLAVRGRTYR
ncbi:MAG: thiamine pyrophosphate-dependent enzyme, partial [Serratia inhibens]|uniref:thiamine pyrophosphate-dependent enzyme n=1 Tax=Serratia inhibens TaxID=2338073 RepID=UPI003C79718E